MPLPVVLTIQSGIKRLRYATLMGIKKAKTKEIRVLQAAELGTAGANATDTVRVYLPERSKQLQLLSGDPKQIAHQLVEKLRFEARVI
jgi:electron transfer flavoprotein beta subunit